MLETDLPTTEKISLMNGTTIVSEVTAGAAAIPSGTSMEYFGATFGKGLYLNAPDITYNISVIWEDM